MPSDGIKQLKVAFCKILKGTPNQPGSMFTIPKISFEKTNIVQRCFQHCLFAALTTKRLTLP